MCVCVSLTVYSCDNPSPRRALNILMALCCRGLLPLLFDNLSVLCHFCSSALQFTGYFSLPSENLLNAGSISELYVRWVVFSFVVPVSLCDC